MIDITVYRGARSETPLDRPTMTWDALCAEVTALCTEQGTATDKRDLIAIGPYRLREGTTRSNDAVESVSLLVIDVDHDADIDAVSDALADIQALIYTSPSDTPDERRFRVVAATSRAITPAECRDTRLRFAERLGLAPGCGVEGALDPSRLFFAGSLAGAPPRDVRTFDGAPIDVDALLDEPLAHDWRGAAPKSSATVRVDTAPGADDRKRACDVAMQAVLAALGDAAQYDGHKHAIVRAIGALGGRAGWSEDDTGDFVRLWIADTAKDVAAGVATARREWRRCHEAQSPGVTSLTAAVGEARAKLVVNAAMLSSVAARLASADAHVMQAVHPSADGSDAFGRRARLSEPRAPLSYSCEPLKLTRVRGKVIAIFGQPGSGKGPLADHVAVCGAMGLPAFGVHAMTRVRTAILDLEGSDLTEDRCRRMARAMGVDVAELDDWLHIIDQSTMRYDDAKSYAEAIADYVREHGIERVVIDSYTSATLRFCVDPYKPEYAKLAAHLSSVCAEVIVVAHANKAAAIKTDPQLVDIANNGALASLVSTAIGVQETREPNVIRITCARAPQTRFEPFCLRFADTEDGGLSVAICDAPRAESQARSASKTMQQTIEKRDRVIDAAREIVHNAQHVGLRLEDFEKLGGKHANAREEARKLLVRAGLAMSDNAIWALTPAGFALKQKTPAGDTVDEDALSTAITPHLRR